MAFSGALCGPSGWGRPPQHSKHELLQALFHQARAGCAWHLLPPDWPPWRPVCQQAEAWREDGTWERLVAGPRRQVRHAAGREAEPTAGAIDPQVVRTGGKGGRSVLGWGR